MKKIEVKKYHLISVQQKNSIMYVMTMKKSLNTEEEADVTSINSINATNDISMKYDGNFIHKYYAPLLSSTNHEDISPGLEHDSEKWICLRNKNTILDK